MFEQGVTMFVLGILVVALIVLALKVFGSDDPGVTSPDGINPIKQDFWGGG